ncbi:MAG: hypothetical protein Q9160_008833 [Pyrenula sp. 1 TL-2023]
MSSAPRILDDQRVQVTSIFEKTGDHAIIDHVADSDEEVLGALGYKQEFKSMPTAGGLYYAAAVLAPEGWGPFWSWIVGWSNVCAYTTCACSVNYALSLMILSAATIQHPEYDPQVWQVYLLFVALQTLDGLLITNSTKFLGRLNAVGTVINSALVFIFVVWLPTGSINNPKTNTSAQVWTEMTNGTEWPTEEVSKSNITAPRTIFLTAQLGYYIGFFLLVVIAYTVKDIEDVVAGQYGSPIANLCLQVLGPGSGLALLTMIMVAQFWVAECCMVTASRVVFAYSRDGAIPGSWWLKQVNRRTKTPVNAAWFVMVIGCLLGLLMFASPVAIGAIFSLGSIAAYISFTIPIALKVFSAGSRFRPVPVLCFPATRGKDLDKNTMNYTCLIYFGVMGLALVWYAISARKWYKGPKVNVEHMIRETTAVNVVDVGLSESKEKGV